MQMQHGCGFIMSLVPSVHDAVVSRADTPKSAIFQDKTRTFASPSFLADRLRAAIRRAKRTAALLVQLIAQARARSPNAGHDSRRTGCIIDVADAAVRAMHHLGYKLTNLDQPLDQKLCEELADTIVAAIHEEVRCATFSVDEGLVLEAELLVAALTVTASPAAAPAPPTGSPGLPTAAALSAAVRLGVPGPPTAAAAAASSAQPPAAAAAPRPYAVAAAAGVSKLAVLVLDSLCRLAGHRIDMKVARARSMVQAQHGRGVRGPDPSAAAAAGAASDGGSESGGPGRRAARAYLRGLASTVPRTVHEAVVAALVALAQQGDGGHYPLVPPGWQVFVEVGAVDADSHARSESFLRPLWVRVYV